MPGADNTGYIGKWHMYAPESNPGGVRPNGGHCVPNCRLVVPQILLYKKMIRVCNAQADRAHTLGKVMKIARSRQNMKPASNDRDRAGPESGPLATTPPQDHEARG